MSDVPQACLDEMSKQLFSGTVISIPLRPGQPACYDYQYEQQGTYNLIVVFEPFVSKWCYKVTEHLQATPHPLEALT